MNEILNNITVVGIAQTLLLISCGILVVGMIIYAYKDWQYKKDKYDRS